MTNITVELSKNNKSATLDADKEIISIDSVDLEHTAVSGYDITVIPKDSYRDYQLGTATININGSPVISGEIQDISKRNDSIRIRGAGPAEQLRSDNTVKTYSDIPHYLAIRDYVDTTNADSWTVTEPFVRDIQTDSLFVDAPDLDGFNDVIAQPADDVPLVINDFNDIRPAQVCFFTEAENAARQFGTVVDVTSVGEDMSNFEGLELSSLNDAVGVDFKTEYRIPADDFDVFHRVKLDSFDGELTISVDGTTERSIQFAGGSSSFDWGENIGSASADLTAGSHETEIRITSYNSGSVIVDCVAPHDTGDRFGGYNLTFDNTVDTQFNTLSGPELYPDSVDAIAPVDSIYHVNKIGTQLTINDTSNQQSIDHSVDGGTDYVTNNNTASATTDFDAINEFGSSAQVKLILSRFTNDTTTTPTNGDSEQIITDLEVRLSTDDLPIIDELTTDRDNWLLNLQQLHQDGQMRFVVDHRDTGLVVESFRTSDPAVVQPDEWVTRDLDAVEFSRNTRDYYNVINGYPADPNAGLSDITIVDSNDIDRVGVREEESVAISAQSRDELIDIAKQELREAIASDEFSGSIKIFPEHIKPGYPYEPNEFEDNLSNAEKVTISYANQQARGRIDFGSRKDLVASLQQLKR